MEEQTGIHLLMVVTVSIFSIILILVTLVMGWETWTVPLAIAGIIAIWLLHINMLVSASIYEYLCTGFMILEVFYYGVHKDCLFDVPVIICVLLILLSMLGRKPLLYMMNAVYVLILLYHIFFLHTIASGMSIQDFIKLLIGIAGTIGTMALARIMINRRSDEKREISEMVRELEKAKQQSADFLSNVSHELRTPINMVTGISEVALGRDITPETRESLYSIQLAGKRLAGQINDILDYTEIVEGTLVVTNENYMPSSIVNDIITTAIIQNNDNSIEMIFDVDTQLPAVLIGDAEKVSQVLKIVIQNAIKFTTEGGIYVYIGYRRESYGLNLDITVCDTGIGMSSLQLSKIYDDFYQADSGRSRSAGGLGLGIPIARGLLHSMEGFIRYTSKKDQGTWVNISIPQGIADETPGMTISEPAKLCIACYFKQDKYKCSEVRHYYDTMIQHMAEGLGIEVYRAFHLQDLEKLVYSHELTHVFIAEEEYNENVQYYEELGKSVCVVLIANKEFELKSGSSLVILHKPFFALPIVNLLNGETHGKDLGESVIDDRTFSCTGIRALVVDDEEMNLVVARGILGSYGMEVEVCTSGIEALERCIDNTYDLIFLDHMMPSMDGVETLKRIRKIDGDTFKNLPIIALTANAISGAREMFKNEGFTEFVPKPIERPVLERALRKVLPEHCIKYQTEQDHEEQEITTVSNTEPDTVLTTPLECLKHGGFNTDTALGYCGGSEDFYMEMLKMYLDQSKEKREEIATLYENGDWAGYAIKVHALKSTSLTIGAESLSGKAKALEQAGKNGDDVYIKENHDSMMESYEIVCKCILDSIALKCKGGEGA